MRNILLAGVLLAAPPPAFAGGSYLLPNGISRAAAVTLHCAIDSANAAPCGTAANPLVITAGNGVIAIPVGGPPVSRSLAVPAGQSTVLFVANPLRRYLAFQAPQGSALWVNLLGGTAAPNAPDCIYFAPGSFYESGAYVNRNAITVYSPVAATVSAVEG